MDYDKGLEKLKQHASGTDWYSGYSLYEARLRENLSNEKLYGSNEQLRSDRAQIIHQLNQLAYEHLGTNFNDLCMDTPQDVATNSLSASSTNSLPASLTNKSTDTQRRSAFICYSRKDARYLEELQVQLKHYVRTGIIDYRDDTKILPGEVWAEEVRNAIQSARVAILLISSDFFASDYIAQHELPPLLSAANEKKLTIYCVILRPCVFTDTELSRFQAVNLPSQPLSTLNPGEREKVWVDVVRLVKKSLSPE